MGRRAGRVSGGQDLRRFAVDLRLRVGGETTALTTFGKSAYVDLGWPRRIAGGWQAEISWLASTATPLFPVFSGWLTIGTEELRIDGLYAPPGRGGRSHCRPGPFPRWPRTATARWVLGEIDRAALGAAA